MNALAQEENWVIISGDLQIRTNPHEVKAWRKAHRWHPNQLRHTFATRVRKQHGLEAAQVLLGHSKLDTTALYARVATKTIRAVTSPLEHLKLLIEGAGPDG